MFALLVLTSAGATAAAAGPKRHLPLVIGQTPVPHMTVGSFLGCLSHDPIPYTISDPTTNGKGGFLVRAHNDLEQLDLHFTVTAGSATLVKVDRDNGTTLRLGKALRHLLQLSCAQAKAK